MQMKNKNIIWVIGGVAIAFILLNSFTTISKKKEESKPSGDDSAPKSPSSNPLKNVIEEATKDIKSTSTSKDEPCPPGFRRVARGGVAGGIFYTCEPIGKKLLIIDK